MGAKRHHFRVGTISGSWTKGPGVALAPASPCSGVGDRAGNSSSQDTRGKKRKGKVRAISFPTW